MAQLKLPATGIEESMLAGADDNHGHDHPMTFPALGVTATWTVMGVDVQEQPSNAAQPFTGTIKFRINSQTRKSTGVVENNFERSFKYVYDAGIKQWLLKP